MSNLGHWYCHSIPEHFRGENWSGTIKGTAAHITHDLSVRVQGDAEVLLWLFPGLGREDTHPLA